MVPQEQHNEQNLMKMHGTFIQAKYYRMQEKIHATKSYISRVEHGIIIPSVGTFYRIINALGKRVDIVPVSSATPVTDFAVLQE